MMTRDRAISAMVMAVLAAIGCGSQPQAASAKSDPPGPASQQLAQTSQPVQPAQPASAVAPAPGSAAIRGTIRFEGTAPQPQKVQMAADPVCAQQHAQPMVTEAVVVNQNGTLKNAVVYVKQGLSGSFPAPAAPVILDQRGCWYAPHVFGIQVQQPLEIVNSDATLHNVNAKPLVNQPFNLAQPMQGMKATKKFTKPEVGVKFKCNVHPWMSAYAVVVEHPFFSVSGDDGAFSLPGLPAGTYVIEAWHEQYGAQTQQVSVADGETTPVEFTFKAP